MYIQHPQNILRKSCVPAKGPLPEHSTNNTTAIFIVMARLKAVFCEIRKTKKYKVISILIKEGKEYTVFALIAFGKVIQCILNTVNESHDFLLPVSLKGVLPADVRGRVLLRLSNLFQG